jgi:hypothetical protein
MTMFFHSLVLGYGVAVLGAVRLSEAGLPLWAAILVAWIGGNVLCLAFAATGTSLWPATPARRSSFIPAPDEFRLWDDDLALDLIDLEVRRAGAGAPAAASQTGRVRAAG